MEQYLKKLGIKELNEMQTAVIKKAAKQTDMILLSPTGSGKTVAYLVPLIQSIDPEKKRTQALVLAPSRELVLQIESVLKKMKSQFKVTVCYGGHKREIEEQNLIEAPAVIIATAGRMADHLRRGNINPQNIGFLVLDEFDKSLELGFEEEMKYILQSLPNVKQKMLTSATAAKEIPDFIQLTKPVTLDFSAEEAEPEKAALRIHTVQSPDKDKLETLFNLLCYAGNTSSIIFCNHRDAVERTSAFLTEKGMLNVFYHGGMEQHDREVALTKFRNTSSDILVTTDLAARGLDIANIRNIIHYHLPNDEAGYTHRNGRTARMKETGNVYIILSGDEKLPAYAQNEAVDFAVPQNSKIPEKPKWSTLFIAAGKKDKINKIDVVGFLSKIGMLKTDEIGMVEIRDFSAFAAVRRSKIGNVVELVKKEKIKGKKVKIVVAK